MFNINIYLKLTILIYFYGNVIIAENSSTSTLSSAANVQTSTESITSGLDQQQQQPPPPLLQSTHQYNSQLINNNNNNNGTLNVTGGIDSTSSADTLVPINFISSSDILNGNNNNVMTNGNGGGGGGGSGIGIGTISMNGGAITSSTISPSLIVIPQTDITTQIETDSNGNGGNGNGNGNTIIVGAINTITNPIGSPGPDSREIDGIQKAIDWLKEKRSADYGWENDTHMVILAKELSGARDSMDADSHVQVIQDLEDLLSVKQMEIEILSMLDRHHQPLPKPVNFDKLARYVLALGSLCKDPKRFHGHDLVATLQHHEPTQDQEFALTTLAACSSAAHVRKRQIRRLLDIASGVTEQSVDTIAMVILALRCIVTDHRHRHLQQFVRRPARGLATLQGPRGSFGSLRSTALAMQALQDVEPDPAGPWNRSAASKWILDRQRSDGGWSEEPLQDGQDPNIGIGLTADIILALGWKGLGAVRALQCDHVIRGGEPNDNLSENGEAKLAPPIGIPSSAEESEAKNVSYTYTLWVGSNASVAFSLSLISTKNTSFFKAMTQAADLDSRFAFEAREWPNGHYVHTLAGLKEEPRGYNYWLLYRLPELPDPSNPPGNQLIAPVGVDELMVEDGEHYLYWYKKL